ncbi:MAG: hypothetical protein HY096_09680 [Nitrospinae bacterium]|nr:hypothetical protein [Nitrospinota bacterium]
MAKKNRTVESQESGVESRTGVPPVSQEPIQDTPNPEPRIPNLRYVGKTIKHFEHDGKTYQLMPNSVYLNLPDCEQVKRLIAAGELKEV